MKKFLIVLNCFLILVVFATCTYCHPGRLDQNGGHWDYSNNTYHYHTGDSSSEPSNTPPDSPATGSQTRDVVYRTPSYVYWLIAAGILVIIATIWIAVHSVRKNEDRVTTAINAAAQKEKLACQKLDECNNTIKEYESKMKSINLAVYEQFKEDYDKLLLSKADMYPQIAAYYADYTQAFYFKIAEHLGIRHHYSISNLESLKKIIIDASQSAIKNHHIYKNKLQCIYECFPGIEDIVFDKKNMLERQKARTIISEKLLTDFYNSLNSYDIINNKLDTITKEYSLKADELTLLETEYNNLSSKIVCLKSEIEKHTKNLTSLKNFRLPRLIKKLNEARNSAIQAFCDDIDKRIEKTKKIYPALAGCMRDLCVTAYSYMYNAARPSDYICSPKDFIILKNKLSKDFSRLKVKEFELQYLKEVVPNLTEILKNIKYPSSLRDALKIPDYSAKEAITVDYDVKDTSLENLDQ